MQFIPTYLPSILYFDALIKADNPVFTLAHNYQKQTYRNRTSIYGANGRLNLMIPIQHNREKENQKDKDVNILWEENWQKLHWKSLTSAYRSSPFFEFYEDELKESFFQQHEKLMDHNLGLITCILSMLEVELAFSFEKTYCPLKQEEEKLIKAKHQKLPPLTPYAQVFESKYGFIPHLSILDLIFNQGPQSLDYLEQIV